MRHQREQGLRPLLFPLLLSTLLLMLMRAMPPLICLQLCRHHRLR
jgi:hypothetical protein